MKTIYRISVALLFGLGFLLLICVPDEGTLAGGDEYLWLLLWPRILGIAAIWASFVFGEKHDVWQ